MRYGLILSAATALVMAAPANATQLFQQIDYNSRTSIGLPTLALFNPAFGKLDKVTFSYTIGDTGGQYLAAYSDDSEGPYVFKFQTAADFSGLGFIPEAKEVQVETYMSKEALIYGGSSVSKTFTFSGADTKNFIGTGNMDFVPNFQGYLLSATAATGDISVISIPIISGSLGAVIDVTYDINGAVPEPATWAMMLAGFGMIGFAMRRRQPVRTTVRFA